MSIRTWSNVNKVINSLIGSNTGWSYDVCQVITQETVDATMRLISKLEAEGMGAPTMISTPGNKAFFFVWSQDEDMCLEAYVEGEEVVKWSEWDSGNLTSKPSKVWEERWN